MYENKRDFIGKYFLCLTELDYRNLMSKLMELGFSWTSGASIESLDLDKWDKIGSSTVVWVTANGVSLLGYYEVKAAGVQVDTWNLK